jgi:glycerophosphoryl diester phosphodiesterase
MKTSRLFFLGILLVFFSCSKNDITEPPYSQDQNLVNTLPIADTIMRNMEGIYHLSAGNGNLGSEFVCKVSKHKLSFFSDLDGIYIILKYGFNAEDSSIQFSGFWRYSENARQGNISFAISQAGGSMELLLNEIADNIKLEGTYFDVEYISRPVTFRFSRHFSNYTATHDFAIFCHHGIQTTANPPFAENSINAVLYGEEYGVNGLEFDVRLTKDHIPICIHDPSINTRLTLKGPLTGNYDQYTFDLLSQFVRLNDGQKIPSVEEALDAFVTSTNLKYMWLDIKGNPDVFKYMEPVVRNAYAKAASLNRDVVIITDLPTTGVIDEFKKQPSYTDLPTMCELTLQDVTDNTCEYWGPRYSEGLLLDDVARAHSLGIKVYSWTLNDRNIIYNYLMNGQFDGFISDYPAFVNYYYYTNF